MTSFSSVSESGVSNTNVAKATFSSPGVAKVLPDFLLLLQVHMQYLDDVAAQRYIDVAHLVRKVDVRIEEFVDVGSELLGLGAELV
jgi:hypothetical protein